MSDFQTQQEIWAYLSADERNRVKSDSIVVGFKDGFLYDHKNNTRTSWHFDAPLAWSKYTEPKPKVKLYKYACKTNGGLWAESMCFYKDDEHFQKELVGCKAFKRLDHTMIEVEDA